MFTRDGIRAVHSWSHECLDLVMEHAGTLPVELFLREIAGFGAACVRDQLVHAVACEAVWVRALQDLPSVNWSYSDYPTVAAVRQAKQQVAADTLAYVERISEAELNTELGGLRSAAFILHHVLTHAFHHKGQIVAMCRILGYPAPDTDLQRSSA